MPDARDTLVGSRTVFGRRKVDPLYVWAAVVGLAVALVMIAVAALIQALHLH